MKELYMDVMDLVSPIIEEISGLGNDLIFLDEITKDLMTSRKLKIIKKDNVVLELIIYKTGITYFYFNIDFKNQYNKEINLLIDMLKKVFLNYEKGHIKTTYSGINKIQGYSVEFHTGERDIGNIGGLKEELPGFLMMMRVIGL